MQALEKIIPIALVIFLASPAVAEDVEENKHKRRGPPAVAIEACVAAVDGDACSFESRHGDSLSGECFTAREQELVCRPEGGRPKLRRKDGERRDEDTAESE